MNDEMGPITSREGLTAIVGGEASQKVAARIAEKTSRPA
jgi:hypothetical protein